MKICVIGSGYVGLVVGTCFSESGHNVICVDRDTERIENLSKGKVPFYEPGLEELILRNFDEGRLHFTTNLAEGVQESLIVFMAVGTPQGKDGAPDMSQVYGAAEAVGKAMNGYKIVVSKSTCPVGTAYKIKEVISGLSEHPCDVVSNPEFLKEGAAVEDFMRPDRVVIGCDDIRVTEIMRELYAPFLRTGKPFVSMGVHSAELAKYASNTMLAARISLINELAGLAGAYGADIMEVREGLMSDSRIGPSFLFPGLGYGGSCFPKDVNAAIDMAIAKGVPCEVLKGISQTNEMQKALFVKRILDYFDGDVNGKRLAIWGGSFKPKTDDIRDAPALHVIDVLTGSGAEIVLYDPVAGPNIAAHYGDKIKVLSKVYEPLKDADGLIIVTEWREFHNPDFERMGDLLKAKVIFDGRNLYSARTMEQHGFTYLSIGRPTVQ